jgi:hypothetical protein
VNRRAFITIIGGAAAAWPLAAHAQQPVKLPTVGFLGQSTPLGEGERAVAFAQRLRELGWIEGRTVAIKGTSRPSAFAVLRLMTSSRVKCAPASDHLGWGLMGHVAPIRTM